MDIGLDDKAVERELMLLKDKTFIEKLNCSDRLLKIVTSLSEEELSALAEYKRRENFKVVWKNSDVEKSEVLSVVKDLEDGSIERHDIGEIPEPIIRMDTQDELMSALTKMIESDKDPSEVDIEDIT